MLLASTHLQAQESTLEEIVVVARQRPESLKDTPAVVSAVSRDTIDRLALNDLEQVANVVPNLRVSYGSSGASSQVFLRGIGTGAGSAGFSSGVGIVIDGVHYERGRWIEQGFFDLDQIEVLKGPQALYFGKNNPAGLIIMQSRKPGDTQEVDAKLGYEIEAKESMLEAGVSLPVNDRFALRIAGRRTRMDGWIDNTARPQVGVDPLGFTIPGAASTRELPGVDEDLGRITAIWKPSEKLQGTFRVGFARNQDEGMVATSGLVACFGANGRPQPIFGVQSPFDDCKKNFDLSKSALPPGLLANEPAEFGNGVPFTDYHSTNTSAQFDWDAGQFHLITITGFQKYDVKALDNFTYSDDGQVAGFEATDYRQSSQEVRLVSGFDGPVNFLVGSLLTHGDLKFRNSSRIAPLPPDSTTGRLFSWDKVALEASNAWSVYGDVIWNITHRWEFSAGARYTEEKRDSSIHVDYLHEILLALGALSPQGFANVFTDYDLSPQVTLTLRPTDTVTVYTAYRQGFKSGGFDASFLLAPGSDIGDLTFDSEKADGFEAGVKARVREGTLRLDAAAYSYTFKNLQVQQFNAATTQFTIDNAARAGTKGVELEFEWLAKERLSFRGAFNYNLAKYNEFLASCYAGQSIEAGCASVPNPITGGFTSQDLSGRHLAVAPEVVLDFGATQDFNFGRWFATLGLDLRYSGSYDAAVSHIPEAKQGSFAVFDSTLRFVSPGQTWEIAFIGRNLGNKAIAIHGDDRPLSGGAAGFSETDPRLGMRSDTLVRLERGRQMWAELNYRFGS